MRHSPITMQLLIVTGFLGAGKTTLVRAALEARLLGRAALLVNEFGAVDVDGALLAGAGASTLRRLPNGCVCCVVQGEFVDEIAALAQRLRAGELAIDRIVLETSGLADPAPLVARLVASRDTRAFIHEIRVVALVDAVRGRTLLREHVETVHQIACADVLLVTKPDLADDAGLAALRAELVRRNPHAPILVAQQGLAGAAAWRTILDAAATARGSPDAVRRDRDPHGHGHGNQPHLHDHGTGEGIESFVLRAGAVQSRDALQAWSSYLVLRYAEQLLRVKGFINVIGETSPVLVQGAFDGIAFQPWHGTTPVTGTEIVVIARGMQDAGRREGVRRALAELAPGARVTP